MEPWTDPFSCRPLFMPARFRIDGGSGDGEPMPGTILLIQRFGISDAIGGGGTFKKSWKIGFNVF
jgi:hypothetical protein